MPLRYLPWQLRDRVVPRTLICLVVVTALMLPQYFLRSAGMFAGQGADAVMLTAHSQLRVLFALIMAAGLIAHDRTNGWYRIYLSRPISPVWLYAQLTALSGVGMLVASAGFMGLAMMAWDATWSWTLLRDSAIAFALLGIVVVCWSTRVRYDWVLAFLTMTLVNVLRLKYPAGDGGVGVVVNAVLPPFHLMPAAFPTPANLTLGQVTWIAAWTLGLFAVTAVLLRKRPPGEP